MLKTIARKACDYTFCKEPYKKESTVADFFYVGPQWYTREVGEKWEVEKKKRLLLLLVTIISPNLDRTKNTITFNGAQRRF